jgi:hypothetical protein
VKNFACGIQLYSKSVIANIVINPMQMMEVPVLLTSTTTGMVFDVAGTEVAVVSALTLPFVSAF